MRQGFLSLIYTALLIAVALPALGAQCPAGTIPRTTTDGEKVCVPEAQW